MLESDADRLAMIQAVGEQFDTGKPSRLWGIFDSAYFEAGLERFAVSDSEPILICLSSDVSLHELRKQAQVTRVADGVSYSVKSFEPDGTGMTVVRLAA